MHQKASGGLFYKERKGACVALSSDKKGFVLYFDMERGIRCLTAEQRGHLLSALYRYAREVSEGTIPPDTERLLNGFPELAPEGRMAFRFMAEAIRRDTERWRQRRENYRQAARDRAARQKQESGE